jgi:hypothetical protein
VPHLNEFGRRFEDSGYRLPGSPAHVFPVAVKVNLAYSSAADSSGLPKALADEVELLTGGGVGKRLSYFGESYLIDGGRPGSVRDAWLRWDLGGSMSTWNPAVRLGQFTLPLPADPETFRETLTHYSIFDQTVGANPFQFFDPHVGAALEAASERTFFTLLALRGHDKQSGLPASGADVMAFVRRDAGAVSLSAYRYQGARPLTPLHDAFWRNGFAVQAPLGRATFAALAQNGADTSPDGFGHFVRSGGGFVETRYEFSNALAGVAHYDVTSDAIAGVSRSTTVAAVRRLRSNSKLTLERVFRGKQSSVDVGLLFAY